MTLTRLDCDFFRGSAVRTETASYVALNPQAKPGRMIVAGARAARSSLGGQIACKLSLDHFVQGAFDYYEGSRDLQTDRGQDPSQAVLEAAFKRANTSVYSFGHKLAAGGRMASALIGLVFEGSSIAAGKVGEWSAYLYRSGELFPFFIEANAENGNSGEGYVGSQSLVTIQTAYVSIAPQDVVLLYSKRAEEFESEQLLSVLRTGILQSPSPAEDLGAALFQDKESAALVMVVRVGPEAVYLTRTLSE